MPMWLAISALTNSNAASRRRRVGVARRRADRPVADLMAWDSAGLSVLAIDRSRVVVNPGRGRFAYSHESRCRDCALSAADQDVIALTCRRDLDMSCVWGAWRAVDVRPTCSRGE